MQNGYSQFFKKARQIHDKKRKRGFSRLKLSIRKIAGRTGLGVIALSMVGIGGYTLFDEGEWVFKAFDKVEVSIFGNARAADKAVKKPSKDGKATKASEKDASQKGKKEPQAAGPKADEAPAPAGPKRAWTEEEISLFSKLEERKLQLDAREQELQKLEAELQKQKDELEKRLSQLDDVRRKIASKLDEKVRVDQAKVESLVAVYQNMKPQQAAKVFEDMNEDLAVEVLGKMKNKAAAEILNMVKPDKAKKLSERYAGYKEN